MIDYEQIGRLYVKLRTAQASLARHEQSRAEAFTMLDAATRGSRRTPVQYPGQREVNRMINDIARCDERIAELMAELDGLVRDALPQ